MLPAIARAGPAEELVGLFIQGCMPFAGDASALRDWAKKAGLRELPAEPTRAFLLGAPGRAFDGSTAGVKLVLASSDDGLCSAITDSATSAAVAQALEAGFAKAGLRFRLVVERDDPSISAIHDREYLAARGNRGWRVLAATVKGEKGGQAMLTAAPE